MRSSGWSPQRISALAYGGRLVVISAVGARVLDIDLIDVYRNETRILGSDSRKLGVVESARLLELISPYFESEAFRPLPISLPARRRRRRVPSRRERRPRARRHPALRSPFPESASCQFSSS
ncbi:MAG: alcohol dehydrogenase [Mycobacterium sp.]|jgi:hypothetical protein|nr:alcohol dehydrogenase [Mycobacterium sp.]